MTLACTKCIDHKIQHSRVTSNHLSGFRSGLILTCDTGTTGCKCTVFDENGKYLGKAYRDYPVRRRVTGHEIDVSTIMDGVVEVIREMAGQYPDIGGIGITSFGETFVMTDEAGEPLHHAMLYTDPRGAEECAELAEKLGEMRVAEITGLRPHEMSMRRSSVWNFINALRTSCSLGLGVGK